MSSLSHYPSDVAEAIVRHWDLANLPENELPSGGLLLQFVNTIYQASLLREEGESIQCRVMFADSSDFSSHFADANSPLHVMRFQESLVYSAHNLRKLSAAANFIRAILGVEAVGEEGSESLRIWGMILTGTSWINVVNQSSDITPELPQNLMLRTQAPGHVVASVGYQRLIELARGRIITEGFDPFRSMWLAEQWASARTSILAEFQRMHPQSTLVFCDSVLKEVAQGIVRRVLRLAQNEGHGGMLIFLSEEQQRADNANEWFRFRVRFSPDDSTNRYRRLMLRLLEQLLEVTDGQGLERITLRKFHQLRNTAIAEIEQDLIEFSHLLTDLMSIDGSLVMDRSFRLIGFGAEILGDSHVSEIHRAMDLEVDQSNAEPADASGTRHRSAYRLVQGVPGAIAFVISQDGEVRVVANRHGNVFYFPYTP